jgi:D-aminopeptidase
MNGKLCAVTTVLLATALAAAQGTIPNVRPRVSELGLKVGILPTGPLDAITDVAGVEVGQTTIVRGDSIRTGVTAVLPHSGNLYREKVSGAIFASNGFGKLTGSTQVDEMGDIETPILLTSTTSVPRVADAVTRSVETLTNDAMSPLFLAAIEATEEAVYNSMFKAKTVARVAAAAC